MRKVKWIFFGYLAAVILLVAGIAISFTATPPRDPKTMYATYGGSIRSLDPAEINDTLGSSIVGPIFECLYNYKYNVQPYEIFPELAAELPHVSEDGLTMTIKIRPGIHFYDPDKVVFPDGVGPEVTATDVIYSFKRVCDFNIASPNYSGTFEGAIAGLGEWWDYTKKTPSDKIDWDKPVEGFTALDSRTVQLKLTHPNPQMIYLLAHGPSAVVCRKVVEKYGKEVRKHPVGTGPYTLLAADNLREQRITMYANPIYRGRPDIDGGTPIPESEKMPFIKRVQLEYFDEPVPVWLLFNQGLFDIGGIPKDSFSQAIRMDTGDLTPEMVKKGIRLKKTPLATAEYIGFNMQDPVLGKNKPLRQAMSMAFDRERYIKLFLNGRGKAAIGPIPPGFATFDENRVNPNTVFNIAAAKVKMKEAIKINGGPIPPITVLMRDADTSARQMADFNVSQMREIGVTLVPEFRDFARWLEMVDQRQTQLFDGGWQADWPDEQNFFQLFYGRNAPNGGLNSAAFVNAEFDALYEKTALLSDSPERREIYKRMTAIVEDECPWIIEMYPVSYTLSYDWLGNLNAMNYGYGYRQYVTLDENLRVKRQMGK